MQPKIVVFAGPNGSGKSTVTSLVVKEEPYINADDIKTALNCSDLEAAQEAERQREACLAQGKGFTFETVLSTPRNLELLRRAKEQGYFIWCVYVLTADADINVLRVKSRFLNGGHDVPPDKIRSRYKKALAQLPKLIEVCDVLHIYDNSSDGEFPFRIFKKRKTEYFYAENLFWNREKIEFLTGISNLEPFPTSKI